MSPAAQEAVRRAAGRVRPRFSAATWALLAFAGVALAVAARTAYQINEPGAPLVPRYGMADFRDAIYYPVVAFLDGRNPYDAADYTRTYPVIASFALYAPHTLLLHLPLGLLPPHAAESIYFVVSLAMLPLMAATVLVMVGRTPTVAVAFALAAAMVASRPGQATLFLGQYSITVGLGVCLALAFARTRPGLAAVGVALAAIKPTYGGPLMLLLLARSDWRPVLVGGLAAALLSAVPLAAMAAALRGVTPLVELLTSNQRAFTATKFYGTDTSVTRIDAASLIGRLLGGEVGAASEPIVTVGILAVTAVAVAAVRRRGGGGGRPGARAPGEIASSALICVAILTAIYHQGYDGLLVIPPMAAVVAAPEIWPGGRALRWTLFALLAIPLLNYGATFTAVDGLGIAGPLWTFVTSLNAAALTIAWVLLVAATFRLAGHGPRT